MSKHGAGLPLVRGSAVADALSDGSLLVVNSDWHFRQPGMNRVQLFMLSPQHKLTWTLPATAFAGWKKSWADYRTMLIEHRCLVVPLLE